MNQRQQKEQKALRLYRQLAPGQRAKLISVLKSKTPYIQSLGSVRHR